MTTAPTLTTERLTLRHHRMADFEPLYALLESDRAQYMDGPFTRRESWFWIASEVGSWSLKGHGSWGVESRDGLFLGQIGINRPEGHPELEIGWVFLDRAEGKGFTFEAADAALGWARGTLKPASLVSYIDAKNARSIALAERLGAVNDAGAARPMGETAEETLVYRHRVAA